MIKSIELSKNQFDLVVARQAAANQAQHELQEAQKLVSREQASLGQVIMAIALDSGAEPHEVFVRNETKRVGEKYILELTLQSEQKSASPGPTNKLVEMVREAQ